jgi:hypothetical protein
VTVSLRQNKAGSEQLIVTTFRIKPLDLLAAGSKPPTDGSEVESSISGGNLPCDVAGSEQLLSTNELKIDFTTPGIVAVGASQSSLAMRPPTCTLRPSRRSVIYAWRLRNNHFHMVVETPLGTLAGSFLF